MPPDWMNSMTKPIASELKVDQRTSEWFEARKGRATASRFADVIARTRNGYSTSRDNYRLEILLEIHGYEPDRFETKEMQWGNETEPLARTMYELETRNKAIECGIFLHNTLMVGGSPDGLIGSDGTLEIKCPLPATHIKTLKDGKVPTKYIAQIQGQLWLTGRKWCDFVSFDPRMPDNAQLFIFRVERDEPYIKMLEGELIEFLSELKSDLEFVKNYGNRT